jgi:hypothetical protein
MAESSTITTLRTKRDQIEGLIAHLEDRIKEARTDLAHVNATLRLFEMDGGARESVRAYMNLNRVSPRGEVAVMGLPTGNQVAMFDEAPPLAVVGCPFPTRRA